MAATVSHTVAYCMPTDAYCYLLSPTVTHRNLLSPIVTYCHILTPTGIYWHILTLLGGGGGGGETVHIEHALYSNLHSDYF